MPPIYEYECEDCKFRLEQLQKVDEESLKFCPHCDKETLKKIISAGSFRLKGDGWYDNTKT